MSVTINNKFADKKEWRKKMRNGIQQSFSWKSRVTATRLQQPLRLNAARCYWHLGCCFAVLVAGCAMPRISKDMLDQPLPTDLVESLKSPSNLRNKLLTSDMAG